MFFLEGQDTVVYVHGPVGATAKYTISAKCDPYTKPY